MNTQQIIVIKMVLYLFIILSGNAQSIVLTFSGIRQGLPATPDRILIHNLENDCDTNLYYPDSILRLQTLEIGDHLTFPSEFTLFQNIPNPVIDHTSINVYQPATGLVSVVVAELTGRRVASFNGELKRGYHQFEFIPENSGVYVFSASTLSYSQSIIIISLTPYRDDLSSLNYTGKVNINATLKSAFSTGEFTYSPGDRLRCTGYHGAFISVIEDTPRNNIIYTFDFSATGTPCPDYPTVTYEGQLYHTVLIGGQCWLRENLNIGIRIYGIWNQTNNGIIEKYCYDDKISNCNTHGGLYQWDEMMQYVTTPGARGLCPDGWHIPTDNDWTTLATHLGGTSDAGGKMKETGTAHWASPNTGATNSSGFTALPGGGRHYYKGFYLGKYVNAEFWSSSQSDAINARTWSIRYEYKFIHHRYGHKAYGFSCRCVKD